MAEAAYTRQGTRAVHADEQVMDPEQERAAREAIAQRLAGLGSRLQMEVLARVARRQPLEDRWIEDLRQYNGLYDLDTAMRLAQNPNSSKVYVNRTRPKCGAAESRMVEMLFPADEKNWAISMTPAPILQLPAQRPAEPPAEQALSGTEPGQPSADEQQQQQELAAGRAAAEAMEREIDDQLTECDYAAACRDVIHDGVILGTGVLKGPVVVGRQRQQWQRVQDEHGNVAHVLRYVPEHRPAAFRVSPWDWYPDDTVSDQRESESDFERHMMRHRDLAAMRFDPGVLVDQLAEVLKSDPVSQRSTTPWRQQLRQIASTETATGTDSRFEVWEYNGPISKEDLIAAGVEVMDPDDPFELYEGTILFCNSRVLKATINPVDTQERPYSVWCWEKDDTRIQGFGVPFQTRHAQRVYNATWRLIMENAALSALPPWIINRQHIEPVDGSWTLYPRKGFYVKSGNVEVKNLFGIMDFPMRQQELMGILETTERFFDEETSLPLIAQGQQSPEMTKTASGMGLLMNSANVVLRRAVKNWDDDVTVPTIRRFYDFNMQYNPKEEIKGDMEVSARGSSVLLVREVQAQNLMQTLALASQNPILAQITKWAESYRKYIAAQQLDPDVIVKTDDEIREDAQRQKEEGAEQSPEAMRHKTAMASKELDLQDREADRKHKKELAMIQRETALIGLLAKEGSDIRKVQATLAQSRMQLQADIDRYVDERNTSLATGAAPGAPTQEAAPAGGA